MDQYADDLAELMNHLDLEDATMVGHSTGGGEVVRYIARHGQERVLNAVLIAAVPPLFGDPRHIDVGDKVVLVGTLEHEDPDRVVSLGLLEERDQVADQIRTQKVHRGSCDFYKQDGFSLFTLSVSKFMSFSEAAAV